MCYFQDMLLNMPNSFFNLFLCCCLLLVLVGKSISQAYIRIISNSIKTKIKSFEKSTWSPRIMPSNAYFSFLVYFIKFFLVAWDPINEIMNKNI